MKHAKYDLQQMQSLPLEAKITMTKQRIKAWYESWSRFEIVNTKTEKTRFVTMETRDSFAEPPLKENEWVRSVFPGRVYVSFSGGKDSTVLKHIVDSMYNDVPALFVNTGLEYPEVRRFATSQPNVNVLRPKMRFDEVIKKYGYPVPSKEQAAFIQEYRSTKIDKLRNIRLNGNKYGRGKISKKWLPLIDAPFKVSDKCCDVMKKNPVKLYEKETGRKPIIGTMACESAQRRSNWEMYGCNSFEKKRPTSQPMSFWTEQDVLEYIVKFNLPYASVYGDIKQDENGKYYTTGCDRTGCMFCMFGCHLEKEPNRFQRMKETHPRQYDYCMNKLGLKEVLDYIDVKYD